MISFIQKRSVFYIIAGILVLISILAPSVFKLNLGIDMTGGTQAEYSVQSGSIDDMVTLAKTTSEELKKSITHSGKTVVNEVLVYKISGQNSFVVEAGFSQADNMTDADLEKIKTQFKDAISTKLSTAHLDRYVNIGEAFGTYIKQTAYLTLALVILMISIYIAYAFRGSIEDMASWPFAVVTGVSLIHDVVIAFGLYVITSFFFPEFKIDTFFITAMLTVLGYSINDTIVVMDRIRSNIREHGIKKMGGFGKLIDTSIQDTLTRSIFTSLTVVIVLIALFFFGPDSLKGFILALIFGTLVGTYSSICLAAPLLYDITKKK